MADRIPMSELESYLWGSAVLLRTNIDAGSYKQYIFPLLFFKRLCDVYDEETAAFEAQYGADADLFADEHTFVIPEGHLFYTGKQELSLRCSLYLSGIIPVLQ